MPISSHGPLGLESEVCNVFSNKVLPSTSEEQPKSIAIVCNILAVSYNPDQQTKRGFGLISVIGFFVKWSLAPGRKLILNILPSC